MGEFGRVEEVMRAVTIRVSVFVGVVDDNDICGLGVESETER